MSPSLLNITPELAASVATKTLAVQAVLADIAAHWSSAAFANSLGAEDMVLTDLIVKAKLPIEIFSLDTGRLPLETYDLMEALRKHYGLKLKIYFPQAEEVESFVRNHGINGFYDSVTLRKACCYARKVEPLKRALAGKRAWITGLRAQQAATRTGLPIREYDEGNGLEKFNPLTDWSEKEIWTYIKQNGVPYNALHDKFYPSIGCAPCTRAISPGEDVRAGRWWWENPETKECGLHVKG
jgi:phosphoadenosine phosphosulfate reductase